MRLYHFLKNIEKKRNYIFGKKLLNMNRTLFGFIKKIVKKPLFFHPFVLIWGVLWGGIIKIKPGIVPVMVLAIQKRAKSLKVLPRKI